MVSVGDRSLSMLKGDLSKNVCALSKPAHTVETSSTEPTEFAILELVFVPQYGFETPL